MKLRAILEKLSEVTLTPNIPLSVSMQEEIAKVLGSAQVGLNQAKSAAEDILSAISFLHRLPHSVIYINSLANNPFKLNPLKGSLIIQPCLLQLVSDAADTLRLSEDDQLEIRMIMKYWGDALSQHPAKKSFLQPVDIEESPLFRFHLEAHKSSKPTKHHAPMLYRAYGSKIHKDIRNNEKQTVSIATHKAYVLSARYFFKYLSPKYKLLTEHPFDIPAAYIDDFSRQLDITAQGYNDDALSDLALTHKSRFRRLITHSPVRAHPHDGANVDNTSERKRNPQSKSPEPLDGTPLIIGDLDRTPNHERRSVDPFDEPANSKNTEEAEVDEYEAHEIQAYIDKDSPDVLPQKPSLKRLHDHVRLKNFSFHWDSNFHNLFHYSLVYSAIAVLWNQSLLKNALISYIELLVYTGIDPKALINLTDAAEAATETCPLLKDVNGILFIVTKCIVKPMRAPKEGDCLSTSYNVFTPVPPQVAERLRTLGNGCSHVFSYVAGNGRVRRINIAETDEFLRSILKDSFDRYNIRATCDSLSISFFPLFRSRGLDPLICTLVRGKDYYRLYKSHLHYVHITHARLVRDYLFACQRVAADIYKNLEQCQDEGFINIDKQFLVTTKRFLGLDSPITDETVTRIAAAAWEVPRGYGSPLICSDVYAKTLVTVLRKTIEDTRDILFRHNLYICYLYLGMQFSAALRPRNEPDICWYDISADCNVIAISDKQSAHFHEERYVFLPQVIRDLIGGLRDGFELIRKYLAIHYCPSVLSFSGEKIFNLIDRDTGKFKKFTLRAFKHTLHEAGIDYQMPLNMPRHYVRSQLSFSGVPHDIAESWMGHHHHGKEIFGTSSAACSSASNSLISFHIQTLLVHMGYEFANYLPRNVI